MTATPPIVDRETCQEQIDAQRVRENAHTRERPRSPRLAGRCRWSRSTRATPVVGDRRRGPAHQHLPGAGRSCLRRGP